MLAQPHGPSWPRSPSRGWEQWGARRAPSVHGAGLQRSTGQASGCSGHAPSPPGTSKREKQYQAHRAFGDRRDGVISARTYFYASEAKCDSHMETFLRCIEASGGPCSALAAPPPGPAWAKPCMWGHGPVTGRAECVLRASSRGCLGVCESDPGVMAGLRLRWGTPESSLPEEPAVSRKAPPAPLLGTVA